MRVPFLSFDKILDSIREEAESVFSRFLNSKYYVLGPLTKQFEIDYADFSGAAFAIGVSNGLDALHLSLKALGIGSGDEVIVPSNTYIATVLAISYCGATPVFCEPNKDTFNIDPARIAPLITKRTKAIMPVHLYGQCCKMDAIMTVAKENNLFVIEDNAQSQGASYKGRSAGAFGHLNATSFYPSKNLGALGEAGAITTDDADLNEKVKMLRNYGSQKRYHNEVKGFNNRIDELQAGLLSLKLKYLTQWNHERQFLANRYYNELSGIDGLQLPEVDILATHVYHLFVIKTTKRNGLQNFLAEHGIGTLIHYPIPPHLQEAYKELGFKRGDFPIAESIADECLSIPLFIGMNDNQQSYIIERIKAFFK